MELLLFGGTSEGRRLAQWLDGEGVTVTVCVATEYGASLLPEGARIRAVTGRLDRAGMAELMASRPFQRVVDATHPYAVEVSENILRAAETAGLTVSRLVRDGDVEGDWIACANLKEAARLLTDRPGRVLLTTGSKELDVFAVPGLRERCCPRVLPAPDSLQRCLDLGFSPGHILCMQGPFSKELNMAVIRQFEIATVVTKASGGAGGFWDKVEAARETDCALIVADRPVREEGLDFTAMQTFLKGELT